MCFYRSHLPLVPGAAAMSSSLVRAKGLTDLYPRWYGSRELLLHHRDPYGADVTREIQIAYYGKELRPSRAGDATDEQRFAYPLYVVFFLAPTIKMQFDTVRVVFWWLLAAVAALSLALWLSAIRVQLSKLALATLFAMVLTSIPVAQGLSLLQLGLLVSCFLAGAGAAAVSGHLFLAGMLLALATIKPQLSILAIAWFVLWVSGNWRQRRSLLWGFAATLAVLIFASEWLLPGWVVRYPSALIAYAKYTGATSLLAVFLPSILGRLIASIGLIAAAMFCWRMRQQPAHSPWFILAFAVALSLTVTVIPAVVPPYNHVLLLPAVLLIIRHWKEVWSKDLVSRIAGAFLCGLALLPWLLALVVATALLIPRHASAVKMGLVPLYVSLELPFAVLGLLILLIRVLPTNSPAAVTPRPDIFRTAKT